MSITKWNIVLNIIIFSNGDNTNCSDFICTALPGACCFLRFGTCEDMNSRQVCEDNNGFYSL